MKANEFVKKFGWNEAKELIAKHEKCYLPDVFDMWSDKLQDFVLCTKYASFDISDLKRIVKSHELVNSVGGLDAANRIVCDAFHGSNGDIPEGHEELSLAIQDVESCHVD